MTDLQHKFTTLEEQLNTQHTALMGALTLISGQLAAIATGLGSPPPTATITLADVVNAITGTNAILSNVHLDTISMDQKLLRLRDAINPLGESLPVEGNSSIPWLLFRIMDAINPTWPRPTSVPAQPALSLLLALSQVQLPNLASILTTENNLSTVLGSPLDDSKSVLRLLVDIAACACATASQGFPSPNTIPTGCDNPYASSGMVVMPFGVIPGGVSTIAALFDSALPDGLSYSSVIIGDESHASLHNDDWTGWMVYVSSDLAQFSWDTLSSNRHATNTWIDMPDGAGDYVFSVRDLGGLTVNLCSPAALPSACETIEVAGLPNGSGTYVSATHTFLVSGYIHWLSHTTLASDRIATYTGSGVYLPEIYVHQAHPYSLVMPPGTYGFAAGAQTGSIFIEACTGEPPE